MITCIWCRKSHEVTTRFRCYRCGTILCQEQVEILASVLTGSFGLGVMCHANRSCGPIYDTMSVSPVERIMWFMREVDDNGRSKKA